MSDEHERSEFERLMQPAAWGGAGSSGKEARRAVREVSDTLYLCEAWWRQYGRVNPTASDLLKMCEMIMQREREIIGAETDVGSAPAAAGADASATEYALHGHINQGRIRPW